MEHNRILELIHQTAPALVADGDQLTRHFYQHLLAHYPDLKHTFNQANQASGAQAHSLFEAIVLFVTKYDQFEALGADAARIAAKHVSVDVRPEDYALVGASLLATIQAWLGEAATPEVMKAWELAYGRIAGVLTGIETAAYEQQRSQPGGWAGFRPFVVARVEQESAYINSYYLVPQDGGPLPHYRAGQFITLAVQVPGRPHRQLRQYSLSDAPGKPYFRISVKRGSVHGPLPAAVVSNYLHDGVQPGMVLSVHAPTGEFCLAPHATAPVVMLAGGMGITPFMAMVEQLAQEPTPRPVLLIHAVRSAAEHPFQVRLRELAQSPSLSLFTLHQFMAADAAEPVAAAPAPTVLTGMLTAEHLEMLLTPTWDGAEFYCCGPVPYMRHVQALLAERGLKACRFEEFGPTHQMPKLAPAPAPGPPPQCPYANRSAQLQPAS